MTGVLDTLGLKYGTDKASSGHNYLHFYERLFAPLRDKPIKFLEIGIGSEAAPSLRMWADYFPQATVIGVDNDANKGARAQEHNRRIIGWHGDQGSRNFLENLARESGPFDIVLDDAGHSKEHQVLSFEVLGRHIASGGFYVIEDMINVEVADMVGSLAFQVTRENDRTEMANRLRSVSVFKGTAVMEFN